MFFLFLMQRMDVVCIYFIPLSWDRWRHSLVSTMHPSARQRVHAFCMVLNITIYCYSNVNTRLFSTQTTTMFLTIENGLLSLKVNILGCSPSLRSGRTRMDWLRLNRNVTYFWCLIKVALVKRLLFICYWRGLLIVNFINATHGQQSLATGECSFQVAH